MSEQLRVALPLEQLASFCREWGIIKLEVFGSALREDFRRDSDLDFLFTPGPNFSSAKAYGPWGEDRMAEELAALLSRPVDMVQRSKVESMDNWIKRQRILDTAVQIYVG